MVITQIYQSKRVWKETMKEEKITMKEGNGRNLLAISRSLS